MGDNPNNAVPDSKVMDTQEFFENQSQINAQQSSLNAKHTFDAFQSVTLTAAQRSQVNFDNLQQVSLRALNNSVDFQAQVNARALADLSDQREHMRQMLMDRMRHADMANYETLYDLGNPVSTGAGDALRSAAYTPNRATDTATAGVAATVPASSDVRIVETMTAMAAQMSGLAAMVQQLVQAVAANQPAPKA